ncbi:MAG: hypothetical protein ABI852_06985 [Gemmatimonadaceae bacterium]
MITLKTVVTPGIISAPPREPNVARARRRTRTCITRTRITSLAIVAAVLAFAPLERAHAQGGGGAGQGSTPSPPAASTGIKRGADRDDPINFLLERKKMLLIDKTLEDSLKSFRKEMQHMQDVVFKDLDKAAAKKEQGQLPSVTVIAVMTKDADERVKDIQSAYRDRARLLLSDRQRTQVDSIESVWKRSTAPRDTTPARRPPPPLR